MRARKLGALVLLLALPLAPSLSAQPDRDREQLRRELKERVDRALIAAMRSLRRELHAMIDEELDGTPTWPPPGALGGIAETEPGDEIPSASLRACAARLARLRQRLGDDHPQVLELAGRLEALQRGTAVSSSQCLRGVELVPVSAEFRTRHRLPEGVGLRAVTIPVGSSLAAAGVEPADVLLFTAEGAVRSPMDLEMALLAQPAGGALRMQIIRHRDGRRSFVSLARPRTEAAARHPAIPEVPEIPDSKALIDDMLQRAIRQVVPAEGGMIVPAAPPREEAGSPPPKPEGPKKRVPRS